MFLWIDLNTNVAGIPNPFLKNDHFQNSFLEVNSLVFNHSESEQFIIAKGHDMEHFDFHYLKVVIVLKYFSRKLKGHWTSITSFFKNLIL